MTEATRRWLVQMDEGRWLMYDDKDEVVDWDVILEIRLPTDVALMLDYTQHAYFQMQGYFAAQWESMERVLEGDEPSYDEMDVDQHALDNLFQGIIKHNKLDEELGGSDESDL